VSEDLALTLPIAPPAANGAVTHPPRAITIAILAMGGEGGGVLSDWIVDLAEHNGYLAQTTSVPGVAQRTGATIYYVELFPETAAETAGKDPVLALMPVPGEVDIVIASELMEAGRAVQRGLVTPDRTTLIASTHRVYSMIEKTHLADGRIDNAGLVASGVGAARVFVARDFARVAAETGSVISAPLFGALAMSGALPFSRGQFEDAIRRGGVGVTASLAAFAAGIAASAGPPPVTNGKRRPLPIMSETASRDAAPPADAAGRSAEPAEPSIGPRVRFLADRVQQTFPAASHAVLLAAVPRLADYQDVKYAGEYLDRLDVVRDLDARRGAGDYALLTETARQLALWMSYEDAIRVADLKIRRARFDRVQAESHASANQVLHIDEFLHPQVDQIAEILPVRLGLWLLGSRPARAVIGRLTQKGKILRTTSLFGFLQLYIMAALRPTRRRALRFHQEQARIGDWLDRVTALAPDDYPLALAVASAPRLVKGYGDTRERGNRNYDIVMAAIPSLRQAPDAAARFRVLCAAALADDSGDKLAAALR
jgi:indolepyruvate ferredoxin oxidoreductase, beta subunit